LSKEWGEANHAKIIAMDTPVNLLRLADVVSTIEFRVEKITDCP